MHLALQAVLEFHKAMGCTIGDPRSPNLETDQELRIALIEEELTELYQALDQGDVVATADALGDLAYVIAGAAACWGIDLGSVFEAIHVSNMTKTPEGDANSAPHKIQKGPKYQPPAIQEALEDAKAHCQAEGFGEDRWWPEPTVKANYSCPECCDTGCVVDPSINPDSVQTEGDLLKDCSKCNPPKEVSDKIMVVARDQAKILAMKSLKADFVPNVRSNGLTEDGRPYTINDEAFEELHHLPAELASQLLEEQAEEDFITEEPTNPTTSIVAVMTSYGAYVFDCPCGRTHAAQARLGSRGGLAAEARCECMCGKAFVITFHKEKAPSVYVTTIEDLRKVAL